MLDRLAFAKGATFDALVDVSEIDSRCLEGTRLELLQRLRSWAEDSESKPVFWLNGAAGSGKSTIARTIAEELHSSNHLGASFFFKYGEGDRGTASKFFPTVARQLARFVPRLTQSIKKTVTSDPDIAEKALSEQFKKLIMEPFSDAGNSGHEQPRPIVIVVDALDECDKEDNIKLLIKLFSQPVSDGALRILLTSRPELPIRLGFNMLSTASYDNIILHEIQIDIVKHDLGLYLQHRFDAMRSEHDDLPLEWPGSDNLKTLVELSYPLFIIAATIYRFVADPLWSPHGQLEYLLKHKQFTSDGLNETYAPILTRLLRTTGTHKVKIIDDFKAIVGPIVTVAEPLSIRTFGALLDMSESRIINRLKTLHSVLSVPTDTTSSAPIRTLHLSFANFLLDPDKEHSHDFWIEERTMHARMAQRCLEVLCAPNNLRQDICNLSHPGSLREDIDPSDIQKNLPAHVQYASKYWVHHVQRAETYALDLVPLIHTFLDEHFLHWCEVMSILGQTSELIRLVDILSGLFNQESILAAWIYNARRFILYYNYIMNIAPLQIYASCTVFAPSRSLVKNNAPTWIDTLPEVLTDWSPVLRVLEGHSEYVRALAWSPNGGLLASGSLDESFIIWDVESGQLLQQIDANIGRPQSVAFSFAGEHIIVAGSSGEIKVWDITTGLLIHACQGREYSTRVSLPNSTGEDVEGSELSEVQPNFWTEVTFTRNDKFFVSAGSDGLVIVWSMGSGKLKSSFSRSSHALYSRRMKFSHDGQKVAIPLPENVEIWDNLSGQLECSLPAPKGVLELTFNHNGQVLAIAGADNNVRLWNVASSQLEMSLPERAYGLTFSPSGDELAYIIRSNGPMTVAILNLNSMEPRTIRGGQSALCSLSYSPDGAILACCTSASTIQLFEPQIGKLSLEEDLNEVSDGIIVNICASDGQLLVTGHERGSIKTWALRSGQASLLQDVQGHRRWVVDLAITRDGKLMASCSVDGTVKIWSHFAGQLQLLHGLEIDKNYNAGTIFGPFLTIFSAAGDLVACLTQRHMFKIWQTNSGRLVHSGGFEKRIDFLGNLQVDDFRSRLQHLVIDIDGCTILGKDLFPNIKPEYKPIYMEGNWIMEKGERLLWLPPDYRGETVIHGGTVAIGLSTGRLVSFSISTDALDQAGLFKT